MKWRTIKRILLGSLALLPFSLPATVILAPHIWHHFYGVGQQIRVGLLP